MNETGLRRTGRVSSRNGWVMEVIALLFLLLLAFAVLTGWSLKPGTDDAGPAEDEGADPGDDRTETLDNTSLVIGRWTIDIVKGEVRGFDDNWTLKAGMESSRYPDDLRSVIHNCQRSYSLSRFNSRYEGAENPCPELNRTLRARGY